MGKMPTELEKLLEELSSMDRNERTQVLLELSDEFQEVPGGVATRPFPEENRVQRCESQAYVWAEDQPDGTLKFHFAVENPQGISARAVSVVLDETLSGKPLEDVASVSSDIVFTMFGRELSMGKGEGLSGIVSLVAGAAKRRLEERSAQG